MTRGSLNAGQGPPAADVRERERLLAEAAEQLAGASLTTTAHAAIVDSDMQLGTADEGEQRVSRTFQTDPDVKAVRLRYRFVTSEVPGWYFGSKFNDYFSVSLRSQKGGGAVVEANSMNGLGAFDAGGATAWRGMTLPVDVEGDVIQVDVGVANVADGLRDSQVIVDFVEEVRVRAWR